jgi:hypothetical protein
MLIQACAKVLTSSIDESVSVSGVDSGTQRREVHMEQRVGGEGRREAVAAYVPFIGFIAGCLWGGDGLATTTVFYLSSLY